MTTLLRASAVPPFRLLPAAVLLLAIPVTLAAQQQTFPPAKSAAKSVGSAQPSAPPSAASLDRSGAYYHYSLAHLYEEMAVSAGRPDYATQAIEEYKLALNADPNSVQLQDGLAELYFKLGRAQEAVSAAKEQVKRNPNDIEAHT